MTRSRYYVSAQRTDGSTCITGNLTMDEVKDAVQGVLQAGAVRVTTGPWVEGDDLVSIGPVLSIDEALVWKQPADEIAQILS